MTEGQVFMEFMSCNISTGLKSLQFTLYFSTFQNEILTNLVMNSPVPHRTSQVSRMEQVREFGVFRESLGLSKEWLELVFSQPSDDEKLLRI